MDRFILELTLAPTTGFAQTTCLRDEIIEYRHGVFDPMATEAVDGPFRAVVEQLQPKQRHPVKINLRSPEHADFAVPNRGERNRHFWTILQNRRESDVSSRNSQFGKRPFGRVGAHQTTNPIMRCEGIAGTANAQSSRRKRRSKIVQLR